MAARCRRLLLAAMLVLMAAPAASAQDRAVTLSVGTPSRLALSSPFEAVIVGNPAIVDVRTDDDQSVVVEPIKPGVTNLVFVNARGLVVANIRVSVCGLSGPKACDVANGADDLRNSL